MVLLRVNRTSGQGVALGAAARPTPFFRGFLRHHGRVRRLLLAALVAPALGACAAGKIEPFSKPVQSVTVGLTDAQTELRVVADAIERTPWADGGGASSSLSIASVFAVLVSGIGAAEPDAESPEVGTAAPLSASAKAYRAVIEAEGSAPGDRLARDVAARIRLTRRLLSAGSQVMAAHRVQVQNGLSAEQADDQDILGRAARQLQEQHGVIAETAATLAPATLAGLTDAMSVWEEDIAALERLQSVAAAGLAS